MDGVSEPEALRRRTREVVWRDERTEVLPSGEFIVIGGNKLADVNGEEFFTLEKKVEGNITTEDAVEAYFENLWRV